MMLVSAFRAEGHDRIEDIHDAVGQVCLNRCVMIQRADFAGHVDVFFELMYDLIFHFLSPFVRYQTMNCIIV